MTVQKDLVKNIYVGNGSTTQFPITFDVNAEQPGYIHVYISNDDNSTTETENYTVDLISKIVTYPKSGEPLASGKKLVIMRELPLMQLMDLINQGDYYADDVEQAFDDLTMIAQQLSEKLARAMVFSVEVDTANFSNIIPLAPGMSFRINDEGTGLELTEDPAKVLPQAQNLLQQTTQQANTATEKANAAAVSESNAASSETNAAASEEMAQKWAESEESPDGEDDADSPTGDTMSAKEWALYAKQLALQIGNPVVEVAESDGTLTITKADGVVNTILQILKAIQDGNGNNIVNTYATITQLNAKAPLASNAGAHNGIFRGKNLGTITSANIASFLSEHEVSTGKFTGLYVGDEITIQDGTYNAVWLIAGFDTEYNKGDTAFTTHHITLIPKTPLYSDQMNSTDTTAGGYKGSAMHTTKLPALATKLQTALGAHLLTHRAIISNAVNTEAAPGGSSIWKGMASGWEWTDVKCVLPTEAQVYGGTVFSSSGWDTGEAEQKLPVFNFINPVQFSRWGFWLRCVASSPRFCRCSVDGGAFAVGASASYGVRPLICVG